MRDALFINRLVNHHGYRSVSVYNVTCLSVIQVTSGSGDSLCLSLCDMFVFFYSLFA